MAGLLVACFALLFTVSSFWWIHVRRGHLVSYEPQTYAGYILQGQFRLRLPLTIYNTGARTVTVTDLRAVFQEEDVIAPVITFRHSLKPLSGDVADFAHPFAIAGRQTVSRFVEFGRTSGWSPATDTEYRVRIDARTGDSPEWATLTDLTLTTPPPEKAKSYIAHRRDPADDAPPSSVWSEP